MKTPLLLPILGLLSLCPISATAQQSDGAERYPARPVKVIVPYGAGAAADVIARIVAQKLSEDTGAQFYVENLPGAGGVTGTLAAARAPADGYTILLVNQDFVIQPLVKSRPATIRSRTSSPVASIAAAPETISVHPSVPATSMTELIALLKANPGKYSYASPGYGTSPHIAVERLFKLSYDLDVVQVPFQGGGAGRHVDARGPHANSAHHAAARCSAHQGGQVAWPRGGGYQAFLALAGRADPGRSRHSKARGRILDWHHGAGGDIRTGSSACSIADRQGHVIAPDVKERLAKIGFDPMPGTSRESFAAPHQSGIG